MSVDDAKEMEVADGDTVKVKATDSLVSLLLR